MANPFDDSAALFVVLANEEGQHSLWPASMDLPPGWTTVHPEAPRDTCLAYVDEHWTDMRPKSLIKAMGETSAADAP